MTAKKKAKIFAIANSLFEKAKANQSERTKNFRARSEANSLRFASLFAIANFALRIYMPGIVIRDVCFSASENVTSF